MLFDDIARGLEGLGIVPGDTIMMHSSMKSLHITDTPADVLNAISRYLGDRGTLMLPAFSYSTVGEENPFFSYHDTPICVGLLPETFRHMEHVVRSMHPTHSLCARGYLARELTHDHHLDTTPVGERSPLRKLPAVNGKILMLGNSLRSNTFMHGMEEIAAVPYLFYDTPWRYTMENADRTTFTMDVMRHGMSRYGSQRYDRAAELMPEGSLIYGRVCAADCAVYDARVLQDIAVSTMKRDPWHFLEPHEGVIPF